jgi:hypothetical protein
MLKDLGKISSLASETKEINPQASGQSQDVMSQIALVKERIRNEVRGEIGRLPAQK